MLDIERPRVIRTPLRIGVDGELWDPYAGEGTFVEPVGRRLLLRPYQLASGWYAGAAGVYARYARSNYQTAGGGALSTSSWKENHMNFTGDIYLESQGVDEVVYAKDWLGSNFPKNRPMYLSWYVPAGKGLGEVCLECGWGEPSADGTVSLRVKASGECHVFKGSSAIPVGSYSISGAGQEIRRVKRSDLLGQGAPTGDILGKFVTLYMLPIPPRSLVVFASSGGGFEHVFDDLPPDGANTITPTGRFWWRDPSGKAAVQFAPMKFPAEGYGLRIATDPLRFAPPIGASFVHVLTYTSPGYGFSLSAADSLVKADGSAYTPDGVVDQLRVRVDLTGDVSNTPYVLAADFTLDSAKANTDDSAAVDIAEFVQTVDVSVGEDAGDVKGTLGLMERADGMPYGITRQSNRPVHLKVATAAAPTTFRTLMIGATKEPTHTEAQRDVAGGHRPLSIPIVDLWSQLASTRFEEDYMPFDGLYLTDVIADLLIQGGIAVGEHDIEASTFPIPYNWSAPTEWNYQPKAGDTVAQWIQKLTEEFAPTWFVGFYPTATGTKFRFRSESSLGNTPKATGWLHRGGVLDGSRLALRSFEETPLPPEATRISVYGFDSAVRAFLRGDWSNSALEDPTLVPNARPAGWRGQVEPLVAVVPQLTTAGAVNAALSELAQRVGYEERTAEWESDLLVDDDGVPLWRGDVVAVKRKDGSVRGFYRILSFTLRCRRDVWRDCRYVGRRIEFPDALRANSNTVRANDNTRRITD